MDAIPKGQTFGPATALQRAGIILFGVAIVMADGFDLQAIGFVAPEIARAWSKDIGAFGPVFSAGLAGSMFGAMLIGSLLRYVGGRSALLLSLLVFGGGTLITAIADDLMALATVRFFVGIGLGAAVPLVMRMVSAHSPPSHRATLMVVALCGQPIGAILGASLCARMIPQYGWQFAFVFGGTVPLVLAAILLLLPGHFFRSDVDEVPVRTRTDEGRLGLLFGRDFRAITLLLWLSAMLGTFVVYLIVNWLPGSLRSTGYSLQGSVLAISMFNAGGIIGALLVGMLVDRLGPFKVIVPTFAVASLCVAALSLTHLPMPLLMAASLASGLSAYGAMMSLGAVTAMLYPPSMHATGIGWTLGVGRIGGAVGPLGAGTALAAGLFIGNLFLFAGAAAALVAISLAMLGSILAAKRSSGDLAAGTPATLQ